MDKVNNHSFGFELFSHNIDLANNLFMRGKISHVQITIPNLGLSIDDLALLDSGIKVVVHSNILNTFGDNNLKELEKAALLINKLKPIYVIEHFTLLRGNKKKGISSFHLKDKALVTQNLLNWQALIGVKLLIENTPITENVVEYYQNMLHISESLNNVGINIDIPHLLISYFSLNLKGKYELKRLFNGKHFESIHLGGLKLSKGFLQDAHSSTCNIISREFITFFGVTSPLITLEQSQYVKNSVIIDWLDGFNSNNCIDSEIQKYNSAESESISIKNNNLLKSTNASISRLFPFKNGERIKLNLKGVGLFDKYFMFCDPSSLIKIDYSDYRTALQIIYKVLSLVHHFTNWIGYHFEYKIAVLISNEVKFEKWIGSSENDRRETCIDYHKKIYLNFADNLSLELVEYSS